VCPPPITADHWRSLSITAIALRATEPNVGPGVAAPIPLPVRVMMSGP
jgi:hypothetical protein